MCSIKLTEISTLSVLPKAVNLHSILKNRSSFISYARLNEKFVGKKPSTHCSFMILPSFLSMMPEQTLGGVAGFLIFLLAITLIAWGHLICVVSHSRNTVTSFPGSLSTYW
ncbi:hypothetical protein FGO68_gene15789 [Halteria grandinella]|uniref:Uncharacterized protein n=1 Tax=Halteria grandinella TaxID=5974 RepID=A0A8J8T983_HALGN|nr:hypothetical protein FGO68_gene15789 [Halteria grandinella]